jgi:hypothetical protein
MLAQPLCAPFGAGVTCVLDIGLSLRPTGLYWALALATAVPTWLPQVHWYICEEQDLLGCDDDLLASLTGVHGGEARISFARTVQRWREARESLGFESRPDLFWHGFGRAGSMVPKDGDADLIDRVDALAAGLDGRREQRLPGTNLLADSARDVLALAAALGGRNTIILTPRGEERSPPTLVQELSAAHVPSVELRGHRLLAAFEPPIVQTLVATGLAAALIGSGFRLSAVSVVAPHACGVDRRDEDELAWEDAPTIEEAALWEDAAAIWWELPSGRRPRP